MKRTDRRKSGQTPEADRKGASEDAAIRKDAIAFFRDATGTSDERAQRDLLNQVIRVLRLSEDPDEKHAQMQGLIALLKGIAPKGELEGMLAAQMVATHTAAMDCLARASVSGQTFAGRQLNLAHAEKLLALYARQLEVLDKHRGKGQQQVTVRYVNVEPGGQAVVGNVRSEGARAVPKKRTKATPAIADQSGEFEPMDVAPIRQKTAARRRR